MAVSRHHHSVPARWLLVALVGWLSIDVLLLWPFLGRQDWLAWGAWPALAVLLVLGIARATRAMTDRVSLRVLGVCALVAVLLLLLGGEGRLLHANLDWRVRDAVLRDMAIHPWPFAYQARGLPEVLRAPIGMYLLPSLAFRLGGQAAGDWSLLAQNATVLTLVLALGSTLFAGMRRWVALGVFVAFSGLDIVGAWLVATRTGRPLADHMETWATPVQYTAHLTQLFWVPQHALAGWIGALGFALWRDGRVTLGVFAALVPLVLLWSPLGAMGVLPFVALAGAVTVRRGLRAGDVALPALATLLAVPVLLYLQTDTGTVGAKPTGAGLRPNVYLTFVALEVLPLVLVASWAARGRPLGRVTLLLIAATLLLLPLGQIGWNADFAMRASITPLALLALGVADAVATVRGGRRGLALLLLGGGAMTGWHEVRRALTFPRSPPPLCSFPAAWGPGPAFHKSTYLAAVSKLPDAIRPHRLTLVPDKDPVRCWHGRWPVPSGGDPGPAPPPAISGRSAPPRPGTSG